MLTNFLGFNKVYYWITHKNYVMDAQKEYLFINTKNNKHTITEYFYKFLSIIP